MKEKLIPLIDHFISATECNDCFSNQSLALNTRVVSGGQPRRVGSDYFEAQTKICFVLLNPSGSETLKGTAWEDYMNRLSSAKSGSMQAWESFQEFLVKSEVNWARGKWPRLYYEATGLLATEVAFVNAMLCADDNDLHPPQAIENCLLRQRNSLRAIQLLEPSMVVLSGTPAINSFLKNEKKTTLSDLRRKRNSYAERWHEAIKKGSLSQKQRENASFQKLSKFDVKEEIVDALPNVEFFWMGHYAARDSENKIDALHFRYLLDVRKSMSDRT